MAQIFPVGTPFQVGVPEVIETDPYVPLDMNTIGSLLDRNETRNQRAKMMQAQFVGRLANLGNAAKTGALALTPYSKYHKNVHQQVSQGIESAISEAMESLDKYDDPLAAEKKLMEVGNILRGNSDYAQALAESKQYELAMKEMYKNRGDYDGLALNQLQQEFLNSETPFDMSRFSDPTIGSVNLPEVLTEFMDESFAPETTVQRGTINEAGVEETATVESMVQESPGIIKESMRARLLNDPVTAAYLGRRGYTPGSQEFEDLLEQAVDQYSLASKPGVRYLDADGNIITDPNADPADISGMQLITNYKDVEQTNASKLDYQAKLEEIKNGGGSLGLGITETTIPSSTPQYVINHDIQGYDDLVAQAQAVEANYQATKEPFLNLSVKAPVNSLSDAGGDWIDGLVDMYNQGTSYEDINSDKFSLLDENENPDLRATKQFLQDDLPRLARARMEVDRQKRNQTSIDEAVIPKFKEYLIGEGLVTQDGEADMAQVGLYVNEDGIVDYIPGYEGAIEVSTPTIGFGLDGSSSTRTNTRDARPGAKHLEEYKKLRTQKINEKYQSEDAKSIKYYPLSDHRNSKDTDMYVKLGEGLSTNFTTGNLEFYDTYETADGNKIDGETFLQTDPVLRDIPKGMRKLVPKKWNQLDIAGVGYDYDLDKPVIVAYPMVSIENLEARKKVSSVRSTKDISIDSEGKSIRRNNPIIIPMDDSPAMRSIIGETNLKAISRKGMIKGVEERGESMVIPLGERGAGILEHDGTKYVLNYHNPKDTQPARVRLDADEVEPFLNRLEANANAYIRPKSSFEGINFLDNVDIAGLDVPAMAALAHMNNYVIDRYNDGFAFVSNGYIPPADDVDPAYNTRLAFDIATTDTLGIGAEIEAKIIAAEKSTDANTLKDLYITLFGTPNVQVLHRANNPTDQTGNMRVQIVK